jgi:hypothetical protein
MAEEKIALLDVLRKGEEPGGDVLVEGLQDDPANLTRACHAPREPPPHRLSSSASAGQLRLASTRSASTHPESRLSRSVRNYTPLAPALGTSTGADDDYHRQ